MSEFKVTIKMAGDAKHEVSVTSTMTVLELKEKLGSQLDVSVDRQRLIFSGKVLKDNDSLETYKIKEGQAIHLVKGAAKNNNTSGTASGENTNASSTPAPSVVPTNIETGPAAFDPLAGLTDARYAGYNIPMPTMDQLGFGADGMQLPDENRMEEMMQNPLFQESMRSMLNNPQMLDYMIEQSPQLKAMGPAARALLQSDYMKNMLTNPQAMKSMLEMQKAFGGAGMGGLGGAGAGPFGGFPAPGNPNEASSTATANTSTPDSTATSSVNPSAPANPFAALFGAGANSGASNGAAGAAGVPPNPFANPDLLNLLGSMNGMGAGPSAPVDTRPPEEVYATQLRQLNDMGFFDFDRNIKALRRSGGSVEGAIELLFNGSV